MLNAKYSATRGHALVAGDMIVSRKVHGIAVNQGGTANMLYSSLTEKILSGAFYISGGIDMVLLTKRWRNSV